MTVGEVAIPAEAGRIVEADVPIGATVLNVSGRTSTSRVATPTGPNVRREVVLSILIDETTVEPEVEKRRFAVVASGQPFRDVPGTKYLGTALPFHVFEVPVVDVPTSAEVN